MEDNRPTPILYQGIFWIGAIAFAAMALGGLYHAFSESGRLPAIALNYTDNIEAKLKSGQFEEAAAQMRMALMIESGGSFPRAQLELSLGNAMATHNAVPQAIKHFERAVTIDPEFAQAHYALGVVIARQGNHVLAEEHFRQAIKIDANYAAPYYGLGKLYEARKDSAKSIENYRKALSLFVKPTAQKEKHSNELEPDERAFARVHNTLAAATFRSGDAKGALDHIRKAIDLDARFAEAHNNAGLIYLQLNEPRKALEHLKMALRINPQFRQARMNYDQTMRMLQGPRK